MSNPERTSNRAKQANGPGSGSGRDPVREKVITSIAAQVRRYPDLVIDTTLDDSTGRDAAFAHAITDAVLRRWLTLEHILNLGMRTPMGGIEADVRAILMVGAAQLLFLDKVPPHAAIDQSVRDAKARVRAGAGGLVNAALRRVAELRGERIERPADWSSRKNLLVRSDGGAIQLTRDCLPDELYLRLAIQTSHPSGLIKRWISLHGEEAAAAMALKATAPAPTIVNTEMDGATRERLIQAKNAWAHDEADSLVWGSDRAHLQKLLASTKLWVQDPSSAHVVRFLAKQVDAGRVRNVVDLCAGQGTKTRQLLKAFPNAKIYAAEVDERRLRILDETFASERRVRVLHADELRGNASEVGADFVLLDVPCSNSGVLARRVEARYRLNGKAVAELVAIQQGIMTTGASLLKPGGLIAYSTCSIEPEEDQQQREWLCKTLRFAMVAESLTLPAGAPGGAPESARDGSYVVLMRAISGGER